MSNRTWWRHNASHPSERDLLLYVNGEGGAKLARRVRDHIDGCWSCSLKRDRLASAIATFMRERESGLGAEDLSETVDRRFESKLRRLAQQAEPRASRPRSRVSLLAVSTQAVVALSLVAAFVALIWLRFSSVPSVSAREILNRAQHAEANRIAAVNEPVIHQQFQVTRLASGLSPESTYLETWHDPKSNRWRQETEEAAAVPGVVGAKSAGARSKFRKTVPVNPPLVRDLQQILKTNEMHQQPISVSAFAGWRSKLRSPEEHVTETSLENGDKALTIATSAAEPLPRSAIVKAELVIRVQDWHPVQERLSVSEPNGLRSFEIRETSFEVVALGSLGASIFEQPVLPDQNLLSQANSPDRLVALENSVDPELEITLLHRLHQAGACLGEEVQIVRGAAGRPEVRGVVETPERKQELTRLFGEFSGIRVVLQVPGNDQDAGLTADSGPSAVPVAAETAAQDDNRSPPMKDHLLAHFARLDLTVEARRARSVEFSNRVIAQSQSAYHHAWALRRLAERFNPVSSDKLSPQAVGTFQSMAKDHLQALSRLIGDCDEMLRPVLGALGNPDGAGSTVASVATEEKTWPSRWRRVFESVIRADRLIHGLFAGTDLTANLAESSSVLLAGLPRILGDIRDAESQLAGLVSPPDQKVTSTELVQQHTP